MSGVSWLQGYLSGETAAHMALMQLFVASDSEHRARKQLLDAISESEKTSRENAARLLQLKQLWDELPEAYSVVTRIHGAAANAMRTRW